jgi:hypothetical protein
MDQRGFQMRLITLPMAMLLMLLTLDGCLAGGGHYSSAYSHGYGSYGPSPYGGHAYRPYRHGYRAFEPHSQHRNHYHSHSRQVFPQRPIWKQW